MANLELKPTPTSFMLLTGGRGLFVTEDVPKGRPSLMLFHDFPCSPWRKEVYHRYTFGKELYTHVLWKIGNQKDFILTFVDVPCLVLPGNYSFDPFGKTTLDTLESKTCDSCDNMRPL